MGTGNLKFKKYLQIAKTKTYTYQIFVLHKKKHIYGAVQKSEKV